jgi:hypothetical protein
MKRGIVPGIKEKLMKKLLIALAALPLTAGVAAAGQPLNDQQMDKVTAGFTALSYADAHGLVGESGIVTSYTATLSKVAPYARATMGEGSSTVYISIGAAQSSTVTSTYSPSPIPVVAPTGGTQ